MHHFSVVSVKLDVGHKILVFPDVGGRVRSHVDVATHQESAKQEDFRLVKANVLKNESNTRLLNSMKLMKLRTNYSYYPRKQYCIGK